MPDRFAIAQVTPLPLEDEHEVRTFAAEVSRELAGAGPPGAAARAVALARAGARVAQADPGGPRAAGGPVRPPTGACACSASGSCCRSSGAGPPVAPRGRRAHDRAGARRSRRSTSSTCTSRSRRARPRSRCGTRGRSTSARSTRRPSGCSRPRWRAGSSSCSSAASTPVPRAPRPPASCSSTTSPPPTGCCGRARRSSRDGPHDGPPADRVRRPRGARRAAAVPAGAAAAAGGLDWEAVVFSPHGGDPRRCAPACATACTSSTTRRRRSPAPTSSWPPRSGQIPAPGRARARRSAAGAVPVASRAARLRGGAPRRRPRPAVRARRRRRAGRPARARSPRDAGAARPACRGRRSARAASSPGRASPTRPRRSTASSPRCATTPTEAEVRERLAQPAADRRRPAHAHRPLQRLRDAGRGAARHRARPRPGRDRGHRPQRDLRRARGAREGRRVRRQGHRRRGGQDRRPGRGHRPVHRGEDPARDDPGGDDRRDPPPGRARLRPAPVRPPALGPGLRAPARRARRHRRDRGLQPADRDPRLQRGGGAVRRPSTGSSAAPGSDAHVAQGLGSVRIRMRDFDGPEEFLESLRDADIIGRPSSLHYAGPGAEVPADEGDAGGRPPGRRAVRRAVAAATRADAGPRRSRQRGPIRSAECRRPTTRSARSTSNARSGSSTTSPATSRPASSARAATSCRCSARAIRRPTCCCSSTRPTPAEVEEGVAFYGRAGTALMKSLRRLDIDPLAVYGTLCVKCPVADTVARRARLRRPARRGDRDRAAEDRRRHGRRTRSACSTRWPLPLAARSLESPARSSG